MPGTLKPRNDSASHPAPVSGYAQACSAIQAMMQADESTGGVNPVCATKFMPCGEGAERAVLFLHGFTSCPQLFAQLGEQFHGLGYSVFIPRLPYHGEKNTLTRELRRTTAGELFAFADRCVDIARGLAPHLTVVGLSLGASLTAWLAQNRSDIDQAVPIAPMFRPAFLGAWGAWLVVALARLAPNYYVWYDPRTKEKNPAVYAYSYPGFPLGAFGEVVRIGLVTAQQARTDPPATKRIVMVSNASDLAVSNSAIHNVIKQLRRYPQVSVTAYEFDKQYKLPHDLITPECPGSRIDLVYPKLIELITSQTSAVS